MADKGFGVKEINLIGASGTPTIESPNNINLNAVNVAISTNTTVGGTATFGGDVLIADKIVHTGDTNTAIRFPAADTITAETGGSERLRIDSSGHLGLGISPSDIDSIGRALNIASSTGGAIYLQDTDSPTTKFAAISYNGGTAALQIHAHHGSSYIDLGTNGTERLRITSDGQVNIGTTANYGTIGTAAAFQIYGSNAGGNVSQNIINHASANASSTCDINIWQNYRLANRIVFGRENANNWQSSAAGAASFITFFTNSAGTVAERIRITANGGTIISIVFLLYKIYTFSKILACGALLFLEELSSFRKVYIFSKLYA